MIEIDDQGGWNEVMWDRATYLAIDRDKSNTELNPYNNSMGLDRIVNFAGDHGSNYFCHLYGPEPVGYNVSPAGDGDGQE